MPPALSCSPPLLLLPHSSCSTNLPAPAPQTGNPTQAEDPTSVSPVTHPPIFILHLHPPIIHPPSFILIIHPPISSSSIIHLPSFISCIHPHIIHPPILSSPSFILPSFILPSLSPHRSSWPTPQASNSTKADDDQFTWDWAIPKREWVFGRTAASSTGGASLTPEEASIGGFKGICVVVDSPCSFLHSSASASICSLIDAHFWFNSFFFQSKVLVFMGEALPRASFVTTTSGQPVLKSFREVDEVDPAITVIWLQCNLTFT
ncbi:hypothetical protein BS47DRAFT_1362000 [Hydnum rufescens UP504]|uniref:Uncharacterized protein n=1 Tax=Hydnum rufescens UP504 TaxID=1448309 RepID=A0A9P6DWS0_9AGAM|nr:hypothetical protein BS47DRAFT_1362000 [Hydnum rufescens UP504]